MTIYEIKKLTRETSPYFFTRNTMKFFGQTLKDFKVHRQPDGRYKISAPSYNRDKYMGDSVRYFNPVTNKLDSN